MSNNPGRNLAFLTYYFPPVGGAGVQRAVYISRYLAERGWRIHVITAEPFEYPATDDTLGDYVHPGVEISRVSVFDHGAARVSDGDGHSDLVSTFGDRVKDYLRLPDGKVYSMFSFTKRLRQLHAEQPFDLVLTTSPPPSIHLAGSYAKKQLGIEWVADYRDVWYPGGFDIYPTTLHVELSKKMKTHFVRTADATVAVSESHRDDLSEIFSNQRDRIALIPNGFEESLFSSADDTGNETCSRRIGYAGTLNELTYIPEFFEMLCTVCSEREFKIEIRGVVYEEALKHLRSIDPEGKTIEIGRYVGHREVIRFRNECALNLVTLAPSDSLSATVPGKLYETLRSPRPLIVAAPKDSDCWRMAERFENTTLVDSSNVARSCEALSSLLDDPHSGIGVRPGIEKYSWENLAREYDSLLRGVIAG